MRHSGKTRHKPITPNPKLAPISPWVPLKLAACNFKEQELFREELGARKCQWGNHAAVLSNLRTLLMDQCQPWDVERMMKALARALDSHSLLGHALWGLQRAASFDRWFHHPSNGNRLGSPSGPMLPSGIEIDHWSAILKAAINKEPSTFSQLNRLVAYVLKMPSAPIARRLNLNGFIMDIFESAFLEMIESKGSD